MPAAARGPISAALGADKPSYRMHARAGRLEAANGAQHLRASFGRAGVSVRSGGSQLGLRLAGVGYGSSLAGIPAVTPHSHANRVTYAHPGIDEWFANGPLGLEQGFTLARAPAGPRTAPLTLSLATSGNLTAALSNHDKSLVLERHGRAALAYRGLVANDARGHALRSWLQLDDGRVLIHVDARHAVYPVRVDPFIVQAELTASDGQPGDNLGWSVSVSGDGSTVVAGACGCSNGAGAAYVFTEPGGGWSNGTEAAKLTASDGQAGDTLGNSVAISTDGTTIVAGAPQAQVGSNPAQGAAYVFTEPGGGWSSETETAKLVSSDGITDDDLGASVAISSDGSTVVAGACGCASGTGAAYVYAKPPGGWGTATPPQTETAKLTASDGQFGDNLGSSVGISADGSTIVAGAPFAIIGGNAQQGAAYVFLEPGGGWSNENEAAKLTASDGAAQDELGVSIAISADGSTVAAGVPFADVNGNSAQGAAYVYTKPGGGWSTATETAKLIASDGAGGDLLGQSVALNGNGSTLIAGAPNADVGGNAGQGAAYQFNQPSGGWGSGTQPQTETAKLSAADGQTGDDLGWSVSISLVGSTVVAGADLALGGNGQTDVFGPSNPPPHNRTQPSISGTPASGNYLVASAGKWTSADPLRFTYQWQRCDSGGGGCSDVSGVAARPYYYKLTGADIGHLIQVIVTATDQENQATQATANAVGPVSNPAPPQNTVLPSITGTTVVGEYQVSSTGRWTSPDALTFAYQWQRCHSDGTNCTNVSGVANRPYYYKLTSADVGHLIQVVVTATDQENQTGQATANAVGPIQNPAAPTNRVLPSISGTTQVGNFLVSSTGKWTSPDTLTFSYQWQRCNSDGTNCTNVPGFPGRPYYYKLTTDDIDHLIQVVVTATDEENQSGQATANAVGPITASGV